MKTETDIKPGDTVRLKSGGPKMTVTKVGVPYMTTAMSVWCKWFEGTKLHEGDFVIEAVQKIEPAGSDAPQVRRNVGDLIGSRF